MFRYFNVKKIDGKRVYEEKVVLSDMDKIKTLDQLKREFAGMEEREKGIYADLYFSRFSGIGGNR